MVTPDLLIRRLYGDLALRGPHSSGLRDGGCRNGGLRDGRLREGRLLRHGTVLPLQGLCNRCRASILRARTHVSGRRRTSTRREGDSRRGRRAFTGNDGGGEDGCAGSRGHPIGFAGRTVDPSTACSIHTFKLLEERTREADNHRAG